MNPGLVVRVADEHDAEMLAALGARTFRAAYADLMASDPGDAADPLETFIAETFTVAALAAELADPSNRYLVAEHPPGTPVGYAALRFGSIGPMTDAPAPVELGRIYLDPTVIGQGFGARLLDAARAQATAAGSSTIWLAVWSANERAIGFYERMGFTRVGEQPFEIGGLAHRDLIMAQAVAPEVTPGGDR
jgi:ribosomal protein S18 acetylase RimI-like enzyme